MVKIAVLEYLINSKLLNKNVPIYPQGQKMQSMNLDSVEGKSFFNFEEIYKNKTKTLLIVIIAMVLLVLLAAAIGYVTQKNSSAHEGTYMNLELFYRID